MRYLRATLLGSPAPVAGIRGRLSRLSYRYGRLKGVPLPSVAGGASGSCSARGRSHFCGIAAHGTITIISAVNMAGLAE